MKNFRTAAFVLAAVLILPLSAQSAQVNNQNADNATTAAATTASDAAAAQNTQTTASGSAQGTQTTSTEVPWQTSDQGNSAPVQIPAALKLPDANPSYTIEPAYGAFNVTYSNQETAKHDKKYIPLIINGTLVNSDVLLVNDRTLAPLRVLTEALGGSVDWEGATRTVTIHKDNNIIQMTIGVKTVTINGAQSTIDVPPDIYNDLTYLPIRFVGETLGARVSYNTGEYDPSTMTYNSYMLVQGVSANATVDQYDPSWPVNTEAQAQAAVMSLSRDLFNQFTQQNNAANPGKDFTAKYNFIQNNIDNTRVVGSVSRYYAVESFRVFLYDKYTGAVYSTGSSLTSNWARRYNGGDPENMKLISDMYFFN